MYINIIMSPPPEYSFYLIITRPRSAVGNVSTGREFDPGPATNFRGVDYKLISTVIILPSAESFRRIVVSYKRKYVHKVLVNCLFKLAQEKSVVS